MRCNWKEMALTAMTNSMTKQSHKSRNNKDSLRRFSRIPKRTSRLEEMLCIDQGCGVDPKRGRIFKYFDSGVEI